MSLLNALANQESLCDSLYYDICFTAVDLQRPLVCPHGFHISQKALLGEKKLVQVCEAGNRKTRTKI